MYINETECCGSPRNPLYSKSLFQDHSFLESICRSGFLVRALQLF